MFLIKRKKSDSYLKRFILYCKNEFGDNLIAIVIYGSYAFNYFDKNKSDYDIFVIFKNKTPRYRQKINKKFPKISLQYFCTKEELLNMVKEGHWAIYITLLKSAKVLYCTKEYKRFLKEIKKPSFIEEFLYVCAMNYKSKRELDMLKRLKGYKAAKWAFPSMRKRLQLLTYIRKRRLIWKIKKIVRLNKDILTKEERKFLLRLNKDVRKRENKFSKEDRKLSEQILEKLDKKLILEELF